MDREIPLSMAHELRELGLIPLGADKTDLTETKPVERNYEFRMPVFDENGEPDF